MQGVRERGEATGDDSQENACGPEDKACPRVLRCALIEQSRGALYYLIEDDFAAWHMKRARVRILHVAPLHRARGGLAGRGEGVD